MATFNLKPIEYNHDKFFDKIYSFYYLRNKVDTTSLDLYVELCDVDKLCMDIPSYAIEISNISKYIHTDPIVELMCQERLEYGHTYAKVNTSKIQVYKGKDERYYTCEKLNIKDFELIKMKTYSEFIKEAEIYETLLRSLDSMTVKEKIIKLLGLSDSDVKLIKSFSKDKTQIEVNLKDDVDEEDINLLIQLANVCGYNYTGDTKQVLLSPYHPESANSIVKENKNIVYHLTSQYFYDKIKDSKKYIPMRSYVILSRDNVQRERLYCFCGDLKSLKTEIELFRRLSLMTIDTNKDRKYYDKNVLLVIDLDKADKKVNWWYDPTYKLSAKDSYALFTNDDIPTKCIVSTHKIVNGKLDI